jgi:hypothetical protein
MYDLEKKLEVRRSISLADLDAISEQSIDFPIAYRCDECTGDPDSCSEPQCRSV